MRKINNASVEELSRGHDPDYYIVSEAVRILRLLVDPSEG